MTAGGTVVVLHCTATIVWMEKKMFCIKLVQCIMLKSALSDAFPVSERDTFLACHEIHLLKKGTQSF